MKRIETVKPFHALGAMLPAMLGALAACASAPDTAAPKPDYYVMRHLQKDAGPDPALSEEGRRNADALAAAIGDAPPRAIYVSTTRRARETAAPAAARFKVPVREYDPADTPGLVARVKAEPGPVLIVGHSNTVPDIVAALGGGAVGPIGEGDYGTIYVVRAGTAASAIRIGR